MLKTLILLGLAYIGGGELSSYNKKIIISGNIMEVYLYDKDVIYGYKDNRKMSCGRSVSASDENKDINRDKVLQRARRDLRRIINSNCEKYSKFVTLTFADNVDDLDYCNNEFKKFVKRLNYHYKIKLKYSAVIEFQKRGALHYHCIFYNLTQKLDVKKLSELWGNGFIKINKIDNVDNVGAYICKYMTKSDDDRLCGRKMYFNSRNLNKPQEITNEKDVEALLNSLHRESITYSNIFSNDYNTITYLQCNLNE